MLIIRTAGNRFKQVPLSEIPTFMLDIYQDDRSDFWTQLVKELPEGDSMGMAGYLIYKLITDPRIAELESKIDDLESEIEAKNAYIGPVLQQLAARIGSLEDEVGAKDAYIDDLESEIEAFADDSEDDQKSVSVQQGWTCFSA